MTLRITHATEPMPVETITLCAYSPPGLGKTTLAFSAEKPLLLDFDGGCYRASNRGDSVVVKSWEDVNVTSITQEDLAPYRTLVLDTVGRALDFLALDIMTKEHKLGRGGALTLQGFGKLKADFAAWLKMIRSFGLDVVLIAHADEQKSGDDLIERIDAQGSSKGEIYKVADAMGRLAIRNGKRMLLFSPSDTAFGKNPGELEPLVVPHIGPGSDFLASVIAEIKAKLNRLTEEQTAVATLLTEWSSVVAQATTAGKMNGLLNEIPRDERVVENAKRILWDHAKNNGFDFDKDAGKFTERAA